MPHCCVGPLSGCGTSTSGKGGTATPARSLTAEVLELPQMVWASAVRQRSVAVAGVNGVPLHPGVGAPPASAAWGEESSSAVSVADDCGSGCWLDEVSDAPTMERRDGVGPSGLGMKLRVP